MHVEQETDNELVAASRRLTSPEADRCLDELYRRHYRRVAYWCLRYCADRDEAADLAQEVFLRVHARLDSFQMNSRFSTWLYTVTRSVAINRGISNQRQRSALVDGGEAPEPTDRGPSPSAAVERDQMLDRVREAVQAHLEPGEAEVLYLHYIDGLTLPAITQLLDLQNRSGAKAFLVSGMRKLRRRLRATNDGMEALESR